MSGEATSDGADGGTTEPGQHGATERASARHRRRVRLRTNVVRAIADVFGQVVGHDQPPETTFWATVDRLWWSGWMTAVSFGASLAFNAEV